MDRNLTEQLENNPMARSLEFSREINKAHGDVKLQIPITEALIIYEQINDELTSFSNNFDTTFITKGIDNIRKNLLPKNIDYFLINGHAASVLRNALAKYNLHVPAWLPDIFITEDKNATHQRTYFFKWHTVNPCYIPDTMQGFMNLKLKGELKTAEPSPPKRPTIDVSALKPQHNVSQKIANVHINTTTDLCKDSEHGRFVAKKYLWLMDSAAKRGLKFSMSIEELSSLLRDHVCYYTKEKLVSYPHEKGENSDHLPNNYLTIDRKDNDLGYVSGNVVACSKEINGLKNQMSEQDFQQAIAFKVLMEQANLNQEQIDACTAMMKPKAKA